MRASTPTADESTAQGFSHSWNNLPVGSVYSYDQFAEWLAPLNAENAANKRVLELGCGNASLMVHMASWLPAELTGVDLGDSVIAARQNMEPIKNVNWKIEKADLTSFSAGSFDLVYCIGVLHHMSSPEEGFAAVLRNTKPGGYFHCWVYGREGNSLIVLFVEPIRRVASRLPWPITKFMIALPLAVPFFILSQLTRYLPDKLSSRIPLGKYFNWISKRPFSFHWHVAFDQLVARRTCYLRRETIQQWFNKNDSKIDPQTRYIISRNGNSWKFGGRRRA